MTDILIIGAGPAGLTAAIYAARAGVSVQVFEQNIYGGQITLTSEVDNFPGSRGISGADFSNNLYEHATSQGAEVVFETVQAIEPDGDIKKVVTPNRVYEGRTLIFAGGAERRRLGCPGEDQFIGRGVSFCATCDAAFFKDKTVAVAGGGDTAFGDALFLSNHCKKVYLINRRDVFRAQKVKVRAVSQRENIEIIAPATIAAIEGDDKVRRIQLGMPGGTRTLDVDGVFVAIGSVPDTELLQNYVPLDADGYVLAAEDCATPLPGVYVAGDIRRKPLRQIVTAAADGAVAAVSAAEYCNAQDEGICAIQMEPPPLGPDD